MVFVEAMHENRTQNTYSNLRNFEDITLLTRHRLDTDQMAEWYRASASGSVDFGFDSESGQTNDLKIGIHSFPA